MEQLKAVNAACKAVPASLVITGPRPSEQQWNRLGRSDTGIYIRRDIKHVS